MNHVTYEHPAILFRGRNSLVLGLAFLVVAAMAVSLALVAFHVQPSTVAWLVSALSLFAFGANTVTYEYPVSGITAPTQKQNFTHQVMTAVITGDGAATTFTVTHNWALSAADLTNGFPYVDYEYLLAAGYTAAALITSKTSNTVVFSNTAFTGAGLRVRIWRPWSAIR